MKKISLLLSFLIFLNCSKDESASPIEQIPQYTITVSSTPGGSVSTTGGTYNSGTLVSITATAQDGYRFTGWTGNTSSDSSITVTLNENQSLVANFERIYELESSIQGNWIISSTSTSGKTSCSVFNLTFTNTGQFTISYSGGIETGNYQVSSETEINLGSIGSISQIAIIDGVITFNITIVQCTVNAEGERNDDYEEGGCTNFLDCYAGTYRLNISSTDDICQSNEYLKLVNDINNKWFEYISEDCDYDNKICSNYYSNLTNSSDVSSGEFLFQREYGYYTNYEIIELGYDYMIFTYEGIFNSGNFSEYGAFVGNEDGVILYSANNYQAIIQHMSEYGYNSNQLYLEDDNSIFENLDDIENCDSCLFYDNNDTIGCNNIFISFEDKIAERNQQDVTIGESVFFPNNELYYVAAEYPILSSAWATHISNWGIPSQGAIRVVLVKDQTKTGDNYNHEESPERIYLHYRYEDKRFLYAVDPKVESVPQDDTVWNYQYPNAEGVITGEMNDLWASFVAYIIDPESSHNTANFMERYNNTTWYNDETGHYLLFKNNTDNFLKKVTQGGPIECFTLNIGNIDYYSPYVSSQAVALGMSPFIPSTVSEAGVDKNNFAFNISYEFIGNNIEERYLYTLLPNNTLRERSFNLNNTFVDKIYTISNFDTNTICP